jgi:glycerol-3-phosphate dehydrogenase
VTRIAVVGGGINGSGIAWELVRRGYDVTLYDRGKVGAETSSATSKLIHGGLRYLETFDFALVRESLRERSFLLEHLPELVRPVEVVIPLYEELSRPAWWLAAGLGLYDALAFDSRLPRHRTYSRAEAASSGILKQTGLAGAFGYFDAQVDDAALVKVVIASARRDGLEVVEDAEVERVEDTGQGGRLHLKGVRGVIEADVVVLALGPWMSRFLADNGLRTRYALSLVRGSHIVIGREIGAHGFLLQSPDDGRVVFALPWKGGTLVGTTEVEQESLEQIEPASEEIDYLIERFNLYFERSLDRSEIVGSFAGVRALVGRRNELRSISRDYKLEVSGRMLRVFGGKMTTFMSLARKAADRVDRMTGRRRRAIPPRFLVPDQ